MKARPKLRIRLPVHEKRGVRVVTAHRPCPAGLTLAPGPRPSTPSEEFVAWLWQYHAGGRWLAPAGSPELRVIYPGARRRARGPDFQGALLVDAEGRLLQGDVEVHVRPADWATHGHQRDRAYDHTLLHVVWISAGGGRARGAAGLTATRSVQRADGSPVPQLDMSACLPRPLDELFAAFHQQQQPPAAPLASSPAEVGALLSLAGLLRLRAQSAACQGDVVALGPQQALYRRLAAGLGYAANQRAFLRLADVISYQELCGWTEQLGPEAAAQRLTSHAGLAEHPPERALDRSEWVLAGLRPNNLPQRRMLGLCRLAASYGNRLAVALGEAVIQAWDERRPGRLAGLLVVPSQAVPPLHGRTRPPALVGAARASELVVNAVLPWALAWAEVEARPALLRAALGCYQGHPRLGENAVTREAAHLLGVPPRVAAAACQQQGLIHLYRAQVHDPRAWQQTAQGTWRWRPIVEGTAEAFAGSAGALAG